MGDECVLLALVVAQMITCSSPPPAPVPIRVLPTADGQAAAESEPTEAALLAALDDLRTRLLWTVRATASGSPLSAVMHSFLHSMGAAEVGPTLLQSHPAVPGDGTLLAWIHAATHGTAKSALLDHLHPHLHNFLAAQPVSEWTAPQVCATGVERGKAGAASSHIRRETLLTRVGRRRHRASPRAIIVFRFPRPITGARVADRGRRHALHPTVPSVRRGRFHA